MKNEAVTLPARLAVELAALEGQLTTFEARRAAINGGIRARYNTRLSQLWLGGDVSQALYVRVGDDIGRQCDSFMTAILPPADSGLYVGYPRS